MERKHAARFAGQISVAAAINASVVQGSGVGPAEYDVNAPDLHPINSENYSFKFADDTYLIVGARMRSTLQEELDGVAHLAANNNLRLNTTKSREMLSPRTRDKHLPSTTVDGGPRYPRLWRWSESALFGSLVSLSQVIFQCRLRLMPCSMQERAPSMPSVC